MKPEEVSHIISRIRSGDSDAFRVIVRSYKDSVYALALKMTRSHDDAEDVAQETFIKAFKSIAGFKGKSQFFTWLYKICYFTAINHLRKANKLASNFEITDVEDEDASILDKLNEQEQRDMIDKAMSYLKPQERAVVTLFYLDEQPMKDISEITGLSLPNVKVLIHRSRKKLHTILQQITKKELNSYT